MGAIKDWKASHPQLFINVRTIIRYATSNLVLAQLMRNIESIIARIIL